MSYNIKLAHIITKLEFGGAQLNTIATVNYFAEKNIYDSYLICGLGGKLFDKTLLHKNVKLIVIPNLKRNINLKDDFLAFWQIYKIIKKNKFDIIHTHSSKAGILGRLAAFFAKTSFIFHTIHGWGFNDYQFILKKYLFVFLEQIMSKFTDKLIAVSNINIEYGLKYNISVPERYLVIRSGVDIRTVPNVADSEYLMKEFNLNPDNDIVILNISCYKAQKNLFEFFEIIKILNNKYDNLKFFLIGDGEKNSKLKSDLLDFKEKYNLNNIYLCGWRNDVRNFLVISDIFILTSLWEGLPRSILEAFICNTPVIASAVDGSKEVIENNTNGFLYEPKNINDGINKLELLINNKNLREKFAYNGKKIVEQEYSISKMLDDVNNLYNDFLSLTE